MALDVVVRMTAQEAGAYRAWAEQQRAVADTASAMGKLKGATADAEGSMGQLQGSLGEAGGKMTALGTAAGRTGGRFRDLGKETGTARGEVVEYFNQSIGRWASVAGGIGLATTALRSLAEANRRVREEEAQTTFSLDTEFRNFAIIAEMSQEERPAARAELFRIANAAAVPVTTAVAAGRELTSAGFAPEVALQGGATAEFLSAMRASGETGQNINVGELAEKTTQFILAQYTGAPETEEASQLNFKNLSQTVRAVQALSLSHKIKFEDLGELAGAAPAMATANIDPLTQIALMTRMRDVMSGEEAGTALRNIFSRLQSADTSDVKIEALTKMGLKKEDVDFVGESVETVFERLRAGYNALPEEERAGVFKQLFEEKGAQGLAALRAAPELITKYRQEALDQSKFTEAFKTATTGEAAESVRLENEKLRQRFGGEGARDELIAKAIENSLPDEPVRAALQAKFFRAMRYLGVSQEGATWFGGFGDVVSQMEAEKNTPGAAAPAPQMPKPKAGGSVESYEELVERNKREQAADEQRKLSEAEKKQLDERFEKSHDAHRLVLSSLADAKTAKGASRALVNAEASAAETAFQTGEISSLTPAQVQRFNQAAVSRFGNRDISALSGREMGEFERQLIDLLLQVAANTADKKVEIKNPGEPARRARRSKASGPSTASLGS